MWSARSRFWFTGGTGPTENGRECEKNVTDETAKKLDEFLSTFSQEQDSPFCWTTTVP